MTTCAGSEALRITRLPFTARGTAVPNRVLRRNHAHRRAQAAFESARRESEANVTCDDGRTWDAGSSSSPLTCHTGVLPRISDTRLSGVCSLELLWVDIAQRRVEPIRIQAVRPDGRNAARATASRRLGCHDVGSAGERLKAYRPKQADAIRHVCCLR